MFYLFIFHPDIVKYLILIQNTYLSILIQLKIKNNFQKI